MTPIRLITLILGSMLVLGGLLNLGQPLPPETPEIIGHFAASALMIGLGWYIIQRGKGKWPKRMD